MSFETDTFQKEPGDLLLQEGKLSAPQLDQVSLQAGVVDREQDGVDRDHRPREALATRDTVSVRAQTLSSSIFSSARLAPSRTSSLSSIS